MPRTTKNKLMTQDRRGAPRRRRGIAFTLLELLVAVGASVLLALALAQLFKTTGDTVTQGRRAAYFNSYAALIQRTLAQDFAQMSRNGHLVIRHEVTNSVAGSRYRQIQVPVARGTNLATARPRRIDELMFFAEGHFASAREAVHPSLVARSSQARIYYGMGTVSPPIQSGAPFHYMTSSAAGSPFRNPNTAAGQLGEPTVTGVVGPGPNAFASDWTLLRHVTLLASPRSAARDFPLTSQLWGINPNTPMGRARLEDKDRQIAGQPAASHIFRTLNRPPSPNDLGSYPSQGTYQRPPQVIFNSGLIDIATTDLAEVRSYVMQMHDGGPTGSEQPVWPWGPFPNFVIVGVTSPVPQSYTPRLPDAFNGDDRQRDLLYNMQAWMRNAMPTNSHGDQRLTSLASTSEAPRTRIRFEDTPRNVPDILADASLSGSVRSFQRSDLISNERMLTASNFVPKCTEFIVEWSFGESDPRTGALVWYGSSIPRDTNNDGQIDVIGVSYYDYYDIQSDPPEVPVYQSRTTGQFLAPAGANVNLSAFHPVDPRLIYGQSYDDNTNPIPPQPRPLVAHFGYTDPTYLASTASTQQLPTMPWAWPALVRVTISLADPTDPRIERTFQFTFKTPPPPRS